MVNNKGNITVFLSLLLISLLILGLTAVEITHAYMGRAKVAEASKGATESIKADYVAELFEDYHLLLLDKTYGGAGEGEIEEQISEYLEHTLGSDFNVQDVRLGKTTDVLDNDCEVLKREITEYMKLRTELDGAERIINIISDNEDPTRDVSDSVKNGSNEESDSNKMSTGDPRGAVRNATIGGVLSVVVPDDTLPSNVQIDTSLFPSKGRTEEDDVREIDTNFNDIDRIEETLKTSTSDCVTTLAEGYYGIAYAIDTFANYTSEEKNGVFELETEYLIAGKDNDYDNLKAVVNRLIMHRIGFNMAFLLNDSKRLAQIKPVAVFISLLPFVTYGMAKYFLVACWSYAETLVEVKSLLAGNSISYVKKSETWQTDFKKLGNLKNVENINYEGRDSLDYEDFLMIFLAEKYKDIYWRMCDVMQLNVRRSQPDFLMKNCIYSFETQISVEGEPLFDAFLSSKGISIWDGAYQYDNSIYGGY